jgi:hypothetical protein
MDINNKKFKPKAKPDIVVKTIDEEKVLFNPANSFIHVLNRTAYPVWQLADGSNTVEDIIQKINEMFENPDKNYDILQDVYNVLAEFKKQDLIE